MNARTMDAAGEPSIACYLDEVPPFIEEELAGLYHTLHASLPFLDIFRSLGQASCYVCRRDGRAICILIFVRRGARIEVLNEMIAVGKEEIGRFARYVFARFPDAALIRFRALQADTTGLCLPCQRYFAKETFFIELPATAAEYMASLGASTRATINNRLNCVRRTFPSFRSDFRSCGGIDPSQLRAIMRLSESRIREGGKVLVHDEERIIALARRCGFTHVLLIDNRLCAGSINYRVGDNYFGEVIAFDPAYASYNLGTLCASLSICESIARGGRRFYLGGGGFAYKRSLRGRPQAMDALTIYRSHAALLRNLDHAAGTILAGKVVGWKRLLHAHRGNWLAAGIFRGFHFFRRGRLK